MGIEEHLQAKRDNILSRIAEALDEQKVSAEDFTRDTGLSKPLLYQLKKGEANPTLKILLLLEAKYQIGLFEIGEESHERATAENHRLKQENEELTQKLDKLTKIIDSMKKVMGKIS